MSPVKRYRLVASLSLLALAGAVLLTSYGLDAARASDTTAPSSVTLVGSLQNELGCPGDWQPDCANTKLTYDANDDVWQASFNVPAGTYQYKVALNASWTENYGGGGARNGPDIHFSTDGSSPVKFYYDHKSHWITSNRNSIIAVAPGSFQSELGCPGDWQPDCLRSWLQDPDGDGTYVFKTTALPAGNYETKVAINESWTENYGAGGAPNGANIPFTVVTNNDLVTFSYNSTSKVLTVDAPAPQGDVQWDGLRHDTFDSYYRSPFGAVQTETGVTLRFRTAHMDVDGVAVRVYTFDPATGTTSGPVDHPMTFFENRTEGGTQYDIWEHTFAAPSAPAILYYKFRVADQQDVDFYSDAYADDHDNANQGGEGAASDDEPFPAFQLTVHDRSFRTPAWLHAANVYQIFPDRFRNGDPDNDYCRPGSTAGCPTFYGDQTPLLREPWNTAIGDPRQPGGPFEHQYGTQFFGGDLKGIENKLDYLQSIGVDTLYLNPIFKARSNHRYDTDDFLEVDPALGGDAALASLVLEMERRGMRLILDGVFNHSSSDSVYFDLYNRYGSPDGGCESRSSPYRDWYVFFNTNAPCSFGDYEAWFGFGSLPVFKDDSGGVRDFFYRAQGANVTEHWYARGASGWRFDVANEISHDWWNEYRQIAKDYKFDGPLIGEIWPDASQWLAGDQLDSVMNYRFRKNVLGFARGQYNWGDNDNSGGNEIVALSPSRFDHALRSVREDYPAEATAAMLNLIDSHDTNRALYVLTVLGDNGLAEAKERLKLSALFQFTYLGAPMVYYGDEAGMNAPSLANGPNGPEDDPYNRAPYPWADEPGDAGTYGPADQSLIDYYSKLAHMRKQFASLRAGSFETLLTGDTTPSTTDDSTYAFARSAGNERAIVALNNGASGNTASLPVAAHFSDGATLRDALTGATYGVSGGQVNITLAPRSGVVLFDASLPPVDTTAPNASATANPPANAFGWHRATSVTVNLSATDGGSGVKELRYWVDDGAVNVVTDNTASVVIDVQGEHTVYLRAIDNAGNASALVTLAVKLDSTAPILSNESVSTSILWPPDRTMRDVAVSYNVTDASGTATCSLTVTSNEPVTGGRDGNTSPDWEVVDSNNVRLRAERTPVRRGRIYTIRINCADAAGNTASSDVTVSVPRNR